MEALSGYMFVKVGDKWEKKYYYNDGTVSSERSGLKMTPDNPFYDAYQRGGGDEDYVLLVREWV